MKKGDFMKRVLVLFLSALLTLTLFGCGEPYADNKRPSSNTVLHSSLPSATPQTDAKISREEAVSKALENAGLKKEEVYDIDAELDLERGVQVWEIDFENGAMEYSYEINALTGEIVKSNSQPD